MAGEVRQRLEEKDKRILKYESVLLARREKLKEPEPPLISILLPYAEHFINDGYSYQFKTKSHSKSRRILELARHVFAKYRVAPHLTDVWVNRAESITNDNYNENGVLRRTLHQPRSCIGEDKALWYICVAQGGSLYKQYSHKYLTKRETHTFLTCPHDLTFEQAIIYSIAMTFAPSVGIALRIAKSKLNEKNVNEFLKSVIYFFAKNPPDTVEEVGDLTDYALAKYNDDNKFSLAGFTLDSMRKKMTDWHYALRRIKVMGNHSWQGAALDDEVIKIGDLNWSFTQIKTSKALADEGNLMRHCVYSYRDMCIRDVLSIWSLAKEDGFGMKSKKVTIELRNNGDIVQARGVGNRVMKPEERHAVTLWARKNILRLVC